MSDALELYLLDMNRKLDRILAELRALREAVERVAGKPTG